MSDGGFRMTPEAELASLRAMSEAVATRLRESPIMNGTCTFYPSSDDLNQQRIAGACLTAASFRLGSIAELAPHVYLFDCRAKRALKGGAR